MNSPAEQDLLIGAKAYDRSILTAIYQHYSPGIYRYAMHHLGDDCLAEDCVAETFSRFLKALRAGQGPQDHLQAYLYRIAHNWITDCYRRQPLPPIALDDSLKEGDHLLPEEQSDTGLEQQQVRLALRSLTPDQRQVIALRFIEGWENEEVASALQKPVGAIRALQFRALNTLEGYCCGKREKVFMNLKNEIDPELMQKLALLRATPARNPEKEKSGLAAFLQEAQELAGAVTAPEKRRHNGWMHALQSIFVIQRKEQPPMFSPIATVLLIVSLVFGGGGATVAAAQNSQPDQPLYSLKVLSEDVRLGFSADPQSEYQLVLEFCNRRAEEIRAMAQAGSIPPEAVQNRYQDQVDQAILFAMNLPDNQAIQALEQIRTLLQTQQQAFLQVQASGSPKAESALLQTRIMLQDRLDWVETGLIDPAQLRDQLRQRDQQRKLDRQNSATPVGQAIQMSPGTGNGNPWTTGTPTPGSGYGPGKGTGDCESCTPTGVGHGGNPWTTGTPTPGSGYGPGPGPDPTRTCTPGSGNGPQPTQPMTNQPTQAGQQPTQNKNNQPTQASPQPTQQQNNRPTQAGPQPSQGPQSTATGPGQQPTTVPGGPGGRN